MISKMSGIENMTLYDFSSCSRTPKIVYPYHYRGQNTQEFADALKNTPGIEVRLRKLEGEP